MFDPNLFIRRPQFFQNLCVNEDFWVIFFFLKVVGLQRFTCLADRGRYRVTHPFAALSSFSFVNWHKFVEGKKKVGCVYTTVSTRYLT